MPPPPLYVSRSARRAYSTTMTSRKWASTGLELDLQVGPHGFGHHRLVRRAPREGNGRTRRRRPVAWCDFRTTRGREERAWRIWSDQQQHGQVREFAGPPTVLAGVRFRITFHPGHYRESGPTDVCSLLFRAKYALSSLLLPVMSSFTGKTSPGEPPPASVVQPRIGGGISGIS